MALSLLGLNSSPRSDRLNSVSIESFRSTTVGAGIATSVVQDAILLPFQFKIRKVGVALLGIDSPAGTDAFNIVVGMGTYDGSATPATGTVTVGGTLTTGDVMTVTINGHATNYTVASGDTTTTILAASIASAINADTTSNLIVIATAATNVVTLTAKARGADGNLVTLAVSVSGGATETLTASGTTLTGGVNAAVTGGVPTNDNSFDNALPGGLGYPTNVAVAGNAVFPSDINFDTTNFPGLTTSGGFATFIPPTYDAVYPASQPITLRVKTAATTGSITGLRVTLGIVPIRLRVAPPGSEAIFPTPGVDY